MCYLICFILSFVYLCSRVLCNPCYSCHFLFWSCPKKFLWWIWITRRKSFMQSIWIKIRGVVFFYWSYYLNLPATFFPPNHLQQRESLMLYLLIVLMPVHCRRNLFAEIHKPTAFSLLQFWRVTNKHCKILILHV